MQCATTNLQGQSASQTVQPTSTLCASAELTCISYDDPQHAVRAIEGMSLSPRDSAACCMLLLQWTHKHGRPRPTVSSQDDELQTAWSGIDLCAAEAVSDHVYRLLCAPGHSSKEQAFAAALAPQGELSGMFQMFSTALDEFLDLRQQKLLHGFSDCSHAELVTRVFPTTSSVIAISIKFVLLFFDVTLPVECAFSKSARFVWHAL